MARKTQKTDAPEQKKEIGCEHTPRRGEEEYIYIRSRNEGKGKRKKEEARREKEEGR